MSVTPKRRGFLRRALALCLTACAALAGAPCAKAGAATPAASDSVRYTVDFDYLSSINPEVAGWLYLPQTELSHPFAQAADNQYYQKRAFDHYRKANGSLYMDCESASDFSDVATYLYASTAEDGGVFALLKQYKEQAYYEAHPRMLLLTPFGNYEAELFAGIETDDRDESDWRAGLLTTESALAQLADSLTERSFFAAPVSSRPVWGDRLLVLTAPQGVRRSSRLVLYARMRPLSYGTERSVSVLKQPMDELPTGNGYATIDGVGTFMVYAQNDELWRNMRFEAKDSDKKRKFGDGGCGPTAAAIALARLVPKEELPRMGNFAAYRLGYTFCACSVNHFACTHAHVQYPIRTPDEYLRYLPLAVASFASGNNIWGVQSRGMAQGTSMRFLEKLCDIYGITVTPTRMAREAVDMLMEGNRVVISCSTKGSPFTNGGHFVVMIAADEEYVYIVDPLRNNRYQSMDRQQYVEQLSSGVVRIRQENITRCNLSPLYVLEKQQE